MASLPRSEAGVPYLDMCSYFNGQPGRRGCKDMSNGTVGVDLCTYTLVCFAAQRQQYRQGKSHLRLREYHIIYCGGGAERAVITSLALRRA